MTERTVNMICGFDVSAEGHAVPVPQGWPTTQAAPGSVYRWLHFDLTDPSFEGWAYARLPETVVRSLMQSETRPRCDRMEEGLILNLRGVNLNAGADPDDMVSLRMWVSDGLVVSARLRKVWAIDSLRETMAGSAAPASVGGFLADLTHGLTMRIETTSLGLVEETDQIEERALGDDRSVADGLPALRLSLIKLRRFVRPQAVALQALASGDAWPMDRAAKVQMRETSNRNQRSLEELDATADRLQAIQEHLDLMQSKAMGRNGYVLSVVAAAFVPLGFLTGLFGVTVGGMPGVNADYGFWVVTAASVLLGIVLFAVLRRLKWI